MQELVADLLYAFKPVVNWRGQVKGTFKTAAEQLLATSYLFPKYVSGGGSSEGGDGDGAAGEASDVRSEFLVMEVLLTLACEVPQRDTAYLTR